MNWNQRALSLVTVVVSVAMLLVELSLDQVRTNVLLKEWAGLGVVYLILLLLLGRTKTPLNPRNRPD